MRESYWQGVCTSDVPREYMSTRVYCVSATGLRRTQMKSEVAELTLPHSSQLWTRRPFAALLTRPVLVSLTALDLCGDKACIPADDGVVFATLRDGEELEAGGASWTMPIRDDWAVSAGAGDCQRRLMPGGDGVCVLVDASGSDGAVIFMLTVAG
nr:hypothetical protein CFP56_76819 [Quercus suber]